MAETRGARNRLTRPRTAFCSWTKLGTPAHEAAIMVGKAG